MTLRMLPFTQVPLGADRRLLRSEAAASETFTETRSVTTRPREADLDALERRFVLVDRDVVRGFLTHRPFLVPLLFEAQQEVQQFFPGATLHLAVATDPEDESDRHLQLVIHSALSPECAVAQLQALDSAWWIDTIDRARHALSLSIAPE